MFKLKKSLTHGLFIAASSDESATKEAAASVKRSTKKYRLPNKPRAKLFLLRNL